MRALWIVAFSTIAGSVVYANPPTDPPTEQSPTAIAVTEANHLNAKGIVFFRSRQEFQAFELFKRAWRLDAKPSYLFNLALAAEQLKQCSTALAAFQHYLKISADNLKTTKQRAAAIEKSAKLSKECTPSTEFLAPTEPIPMGLAEPGAGTEDRPENEARVEWRGLGGNVGQKNVGQENVGQEKEQTDDNNTLHWRVAFGVGIITTGAFGGASLFFRARTHQLEALANTEQLRSLDSCNEPGANYELKRLCDEGNRTARNANIGLAAALVTGVVTAYLGYRSFLSSGGSNANPKPREPKPREPKPREPKPREPKVQIVPFGPGDFGGSIAVTF